VVIFGCFFVNSGGIGQSDSAWPIRR
jgi:hypothetical protein